MYSVYKDILKNSKISLIWFSYNQNENLQDAIRPTVAYGAETKCVTGKEEGTKKI